jgi:hypothetical protein
MHSRSSTLSLVGAAALVLLAGCATTSQQTPPDGTSSPPPTTEPVTNPSTPSPSSGTTPWHKARVGDRVVYAFSGNHRAMRPQTNEVRISGRLALEVVAVQAPWVWMKLSFSDEAARPGTGPLSKELVFPMSMEASRPLEWSREGTESAEQLSAGGRTWEAKRYLSDRRPVDGPLENRLYATSPGPLYLMNGLLSASTTLSGFGASGGHQLTLVEFKQGEEGRTATPPAMQHPLGPGTWSDVSVNMGSGAETHRTCISAERGFVLTSTAPASAGSAPCPSFADAELVPVEEALLTLIPWSAEVARSPMVSGTPSRRGGLSLKGRTVPALTFETPETADGSRQVRVEVYAADPWDASLDGLHLLARFTALSEGVNRVEGKDQLKSTYSKKLADWGVWAGGAK